MYAFKSVSCVRDKKKKKVRRCLIVNYTAGEKCASVLLSRRAQCEPAPVCGLSTHTEIMSDNKINKHQRDLGCFTSRKAVTLMITHKPRRTTPGPSDHNVRSVLVIFASA